jgi:hypothetical protein
MWLEIVGSDFVDHGGPPENNEWTGFTGLTR